MAEEMPEGVAEQVTAWVGLGANLGEPAQQIEQALQQLDALPSTRLLCRSSLYRSAPMGPSDQPDYLNAVAGLNTTLSPDQLLSALLDTEQALGRRRAGRRWGPRVIDLDLLAYGDEQRESEFLRLPHPGIAQRAFVLQPWQELAPDFQVPGQGTVAELHAALESQDVEIVSESP